MFRRRPSRPKFRRPSRQSLIARWWRAWRLPLLLVFLCALWWFFYRPYASEQGWVRVTDRFVACGEEWNGADGCVVDGDTLIIGHRGNRRRIRLTGYDAPEIKGACQAETRKAELARAALIEWLERGPFEWSGDAEPPRDQYGRELRAARRILRDDSREYLAEVLIKRGLASESGWGAEPIDWCR